MCGKYRYNIFMVFEVINEKLHEVYKKIPCSFNLIGKLRPWVLVENIFICLDVDYQLFEFVVTIAETPCIYRVSPTFVNIFKNS